MSFTESDDEHKLLASITKLLRWIDHNGYSGYDPYDALNSPIIKFFTFNRKYLRIGATQVIKCLPINTRKFLKTQKSINPKAMGLLASGYLKMYRVTPKKDFLNKAVECLNWLENNYVRGYSGKCWGYNFDWQSGNFFLPKYEPSVVVTSTVANAFLDAYKILKNDSYLNMAESACNFILNDLNISEASSGICFSYTPFDKTRIFNASMFASSLLSKVYSYTKNEKFLEYAKKSVNYVVDKQCHDGFWYYGYKEDDTLLKQIDFHQGFIIDGLLDFMKYTNLNSDKFFGAIKKGAEFYRKKQFMGSGICKYRYPKLYPIDIHNQAQGIITFSKLSKIKPEYLDFAKKIAGWTIEHMQNPAGYFYYQKHGYYINKIPYIRWAQAWMLLALATLLEAINNEK
ncbi:MAG: glycoside hydrolase family 76 protein [Thermoplasmatales archaeon]|nr:glycoside hydrolase family 76 protein [Thermoplasmatales archaeon]